MIAVDKATNQHPTITGYLLWRIKRDEFSVYVSAVLWLIETADLSRIVWRNTADLLLIFTFLTNVLSNKAINGLSIIFYNVNNMHINLKKN